MASKIHCLLFVEKKLEKISFAIDNDSDKDYHI